MGAGYCGLEASGLVAWFKKEKTPKQPPTERRLKMPEGLWVKCQACKEMVYKKEVLRHANVCPKCNYHFRISARTRLEMLLDDGHYEEFDADLAPVDALNFQDIKPYSKRLTVSSAGGGNSSRSTFER